MSPKLMSGDKYLLNIHKFTHNRIKRRPHVYRRGGRKDPGFNIRHSIEGNDLVLRINLDAERRKSSSERSWMVACSKGPTFLAIIPELEQHAKKLGLLHMILNLYDPIDPLES